MSQKVWAQMEMISSQKKFENMKSNSLYTLFPSYT